MRFVHRGIRNLRVPSVGDSYVLIGPDIPQQIRRFTFATGAIFETAVAVLYVSGSGDYVFRAIRNFTDSTSTAVTIDGIVSGASTYITLVMANNGVQLIGNNGVITVDGNNNPTLDTVTSLIATGISTDTISVATLLEILDTATATINGILEVTSVGFIDVNAGSQLFMNGLLQVESGGAINVNSGGAINVNVGGDVAYDGNSILFTDTWTPTLTNFTLGTGSSTVARYNLVGELLFYLIHITLGTGGALTGNPTATLPFTPDSGVYPSGVIMGHGEFNDTSAGNRYPTDVIATNSQTLQWRYHVTSGANATYGTPSATAPFTWAVGDEIMATGVVTIAS